jgi:hypothetical protein
MFRASLHPSSGVLETVTSTSGIGHNIGAAASFQRGLIRTDLHGIMNLKFARVRLDAVVQWRNWREIIQ